MILTYKYRYYPTKNQMIYINNTFTVIKKYWNRLLKEKTMIYKESGQIYIHLIKDVLIYDEYISNDKYDVYGVQNSIMQLNDLYVRNNKNNKPLKLKSDLDQKTYFINNYKNRISIKENNIFIKRLGNIQVKYSRPIPKNAIIKKATIIKTKTMKYYICISFETERIIQKENLNLNKAIGLDFSVSNLYVDSNGNKGKQTIQNERISKYYNKLDSLYDSLHRKKPGSSNYKKVYLKILKVYEHIKNKRNDYLHKESHKIVNKYDIIAIESLNLKQMASLPFVNKETGNKFKLGKRVYDASYARFLSFLEYKSKLYGKRLITVDEHFPSSQICFTCGYINKETKQFNKKTIICPQCGKIYDRDINAAKNIKKEGIRLIESKMRK
ncbi:transposase [bacterium]|nr:transposase [bacterium]